MDGGRIYGGDNDMIALLENPNNNSLWISSPSPSFNETTMMNFDNNEPHQGRKASVKREYNDYNTGEEEFNSNPFQSEKKRRLSQAQVEFLEKSFENENKLEPERKMKLAKDLGLEPRQVAIWFQNRRARYKTKQLEKEYGSLKANYDRLKLDFDSISKERDALQIEVEVLTKKLKQRDEAKNTNPAYRLHPDTMAPKMETVNMEETGLFVVPSTIKQSMEESSSAKSDIVDSESPHCTNEEHFSVMDNPIDHQIDFLKVEDDGCYESYDLNLNYSCNFSLGDDQPFWSMLY